MKDFATRLRKDFTPQIGAVAAVFLKTLHQTLEVETLGAWPDGPLLVALWHGEQQLILPGRPRDKRWMVLSSMSEDGRLQSAILKRLGIDTVAGSSSRGGARGLLALTRAVRGGCSVAMAVDGPRGPRHVVKPGLVELARLTGVPIVAVRGVATASWTASRSWDRFELPKPGARIVLNVGAPFQVQGARRVVVDDMTQRLQRELEALEVSS